MTPDEFKFACSILDDNRKLIAEGKRQRWEVIKWAVALNIGLATAAVAIDRRAAGWMMLAFSIVVTAIGWGLILYYTKRMTGARNDSVRVYEYLHSNGINCRAIFGSQDIFKERTWRHDFGELCIFTIIFIGSWVPIFIAASQFH